VFSQLTFHATFEALVLPCAYLYGSHDEFSCAKVYPLPQSIRTMKFVSAIILSLMPLDFASRASARGLGQEKKAICHKDEEVSDYVRINIAEPAWETHLAHGDFTVGEDVPEMIGYGFDDDCQPVECIGDLVGLQNAVLVAHTSGETPTEITLCTGTYAFDTPINVGDKAIDVRCIISEGGSCILDGQDASRIFSSIDANFNLNFQDLTFKAGKPTVSAELLFPSHSRAQRYEQL
jgi:hypothetical protein